MVDTDIFNLSLFILCMNYLFYLLYFFSFIPLEWIFKSYSISSPTINLVAIYSFIIVPVVNLKVPYITKVLYKSEFLTPFTPLLTYVPLLSYIDVRYYTFPNILCCFMWSFSILLYTTVSFYFFSHSIYISILELGQFPSREQIFVHLTDKKIFCFYQELYSFDCHI